MMMTTRKKRAYRYTPPPPPEVMAERDRQIVLDYRDRGLSLYAVGDLHGLSAERVRRILQREGVEVRRPGRRPRYWRERYTAAREAPAALRVPPVSSSAGGDAHA